MGFRAKIFLGFILFIVIFGFRFLCVNCQQVVADGGILVVEDHLEPQAWRQHDPTELNMDHEITVVSSYHSPSQTWPPSSGQTTRRRRKPSSNSTRKRRRRPQGSDIITESNELANNYWEGQVQEDTLNDTVYLSFSNSSDYFSSTETANSAEDSQEPMMKRPYNQSKHRVEKIREPLAALEQEQRLSEIRNKQRRRYSTTEVPFDVPSVPAYRDKSYRKPYSQAKRVEEYVSQAPVRSASDLKDILKNSGGLSLSEILQQKNLSLEDLIKGKQNALQALQTPVTPTNGPTTKYTKPIRRIPLSYLTSTTPSTTTTTTTTEAAVERSWESTSDDSSINTQFGSEEPQDKATSDNLIQHNDYSTSSSVNDYTASSQLISRSSESPEKSKSLYSSENISTGYQRSDSVEEESHETQPVRIVHPTKSSYRKRITIRPVLRFITSPNPPKDSSSSSESLSDEKQSAKTLHDNKSSSSSQESIENHKEPESNLIEKFATFEEAKPKDVASIEDLFRPLYPKKDNSNLFEAITSRVDIIAEKHFNKDKVGVTETYPQHSTGPDTIQEVEDRTDLLELLEDRRSGNRLMKVLAQRNMTLDELIQHRQRGSSQLHLSEINQNKTGALARAFSFKPEVLNEKLDIVTAFDNFPHFNLGSVKSISPEDIKRDSEGSSYFTSIIDIKPNDDDLLKGVRDMKSLSFDPVDPTIFEASAEDKSIDFYAQPWKSFALPISSYTSHDTSNYLNQPAAAEASPQISSQQDQQQQEDESPDTDTYKLDTVAQIEDEVARSHDILDLELTGHGLRRLPVMQTGEIPIGVKSAVTASSLIVIFSLAIFLIIFVVCRWKQKRRKKLTYLDNYHTMKKTHLPIISTQSTMKRIDPPMLAGHSTKIGTSGGNPMLFAGTRNSHKINTMDPNSPEVQEYLFDAMRKPF